MKSGESSAPSEREPLVIAIDGPSASGKSTVARNVAEALQFNYVDTGAMYRAVTWKCLELGVNPTDTAGVITLLSKTRIEVELREHRSRVLIDGEDPAAFIRTESVNQNVSAVAAIPEVRTRLVSEQRSLARHGDLVMEGRDIGTAVFPGTPYKFYLDAHPEVRAQRRAAETNASDQATARSLQKRDKQDTTRAASPLKIADDAVIIDTSDQSIDGVVDAILKEIRSKRFQVR